MRASSVVKRQSIAACGVAPLLPGGDLRLEGREVGHAPVQALAAEDTQLDLGHVQPTAVLGRVVDLQLVRQPFGLLSDERLVQAAGVWVFRLSITSTIRSASG